MASPTQTVVGKGILNPLIADGLLKTLVDLVPLSPLKSLTNSHPQNGRTTKNTGVHLPIEMNWILSS